MLHRKLILTVASIVLSSCGIGTTARPPTSISADSIATAVYSTALSIDAATLATTPATPAPTAPATLTPVPRAPTESRTPRSRIPLAAIQVRAPGAMSRIVSPLEAELLVVATDRKRVEIALFGEDGRLIGRSVVAVQGNPLGDPLLVKVPFEIRAAEEQGHLQISTKKDRGRIQSLITVPVLLLSSGQNQINPAGEAIYERVAFSDFAPNSAISGGLLEIEGQILPYDRGPLIIELITEAGKSLSLRVVNVSGSDWQAVKTSLPYRVSTTTPARLYVHQTDDLLGGEGYVFSQALTLNP